MESESKGSVTRWLGDLQGGDAEAARLLWERYSERLIRLAREKLRSNPRSRAVEDEEDAALSAFESFCDRAMRGGYPDLTDRDELWRLLFQITARKAFDQIERSNRQKRGGEFRRVEPGADGEFSILAMIADHEPGPELAAILAEEFERLLALLPDRNYRSIVVWKMEGYSREEIAARLECSLKTVSNKLRFIRRAWKETES